MTQSFVRTMSIVAGAAILLCAASSAAPQEAAKVDVTGKWAFTVETSAGSGTPKFTFKQEGEKLTGHYSGQLGEAELTGSVKGSAITFTFTGDAAGTAIEATYNGTVENKDSMKGKVTLGGFGEGTFTGKRQ
jgi:hypothetical protein